MEIAAEKIYRMRLPTIQLKEKETSEILNDTSREALEKMQRCNYCNTKLVFAHEIDLEFLEITENSKCLGCGATRETKKFSIQ